MFSGNGAQFPGMGQVALRTNAEFRAAVEAVDKHLCADLGWSVAARIEDGVDAMALARADIAQPLFLRSRSALSAPCVPMVLSPVLTLDTASAKLLPPGALAPCRLPMRCGLSLPAAAVNSAPMVKVAWRRWRWVTRRQSSFSPRSAVRQRLQLSMPGSR